MKTLPPEISDAERAVNAYKHELLIRVAAVIVKAALKARYVSANDVPEDIVAKEHRQGVASNAWNSLAALEIIERVPLTLTLEEQKIFGGRTMNTHEGAKGRWVAVYKLRDRKLALTWMDRNGVAHEALCDQDGFQPEFFPAQ